MICNCACRCVLMIVNTVTIVAGVALLIFGAIMVWGMSVFTKIMTKFVSPIVSMVDSNGRHEAITNMVEIVMKGISPIGMMVFCLGASIAILSVIGYCGACCNYKVVLYLYAVLIGVVALAILIAVIVYYAKRSSFAGYTIKMLDEHFKGYTSMRAENANSAMVLIMSHRYKCCGLKDGAFPKLSTEDTYRDKTYTGLTNPIPCCKMDNNYNIIGANCPAEFNTNNSYIGEFCEVGFKTELVRFMNYGAYVLLATIGVLLILIAFTILTIKIDLV